MYSSPPTLILLSLKSIPSTTKGQHQVLKDPSWQELQCELCPLCHTLGDFSTTKHSLTLLKLFSYVAPAATNCTQLPPVLSPYKHFFSKYNFISVRSYIENQKIVTVKTPPPPCTYVLVCRSTRIHTQSHRGPALTDYPWEDFSMWWRILCKPHVQLTDTPLHNPNTGLGYNLYAQFWFQVRIVCIHALNTNTEPITFYMQVLVRYTQSYTSDRLKT